MNKVLYFTLLLLAQLTKISSAIWCYRCTSATPGCGESFNWRGIGYLGESCPYDHDICVKVTERKGAHVTYTRDCLSSLNFRTDVPSDHYEGCRKAVEDVRIANYVNHTTKEHDVKRNYYTSVEFCFCFLDHRCNSSLTLKLTEASIVVLILPFFISLFYKINF